jgi:peptidoglycan/xylan/chitin deacetylase (PgdA/CDA1 family)
MADNQVLNVCFHGVGAPRRELEPGEDVYWVTADRFRHILDALATWPDARISFDDGNASDVQIALPALVERGLRADFFVLAGRLGEPGSLDEDGVRELRRYGMGVGSHGMRHRSWRDMDTRDAHDELVAARDRLTEVAQLPVDTAACPLGAYDRRVLDSLRQHGYRRVYTSDRRPARGGAWLQPRYSVRKDDTPELLHEELRTAAPLTRRFRGSAVGLVKRWR